jgi:hypothetical protein
LSAGGAVSRLWVKAKEKPRSGSAKYHILGSVIAEQEGPAQNGDVRIDPRRFPRIAQASRLRTEGRDHTREFEYGLEVFVAGCRATLPPQ